MILSSMINLKKNKFPVSIMVLIIEGSILLLGLVWMILRKIPVFDAIKITPSAIISGIIWGFVILASSMIFYAIDQFVFNMKMKNLIECYIYPVFKKITFPEIVLMAVLSGFCEEFFFRGILMPEFGILAASVIFGLLHTASKETWFLGAWSGLVGFIFGLIYLKTGNLFIPMVAHGVNNFVAVCFVRYFHDTLKEKLKETLGELEESDSKDAPIEEISVEKPAETEESPVEAPAAEDKKEASPPVEDMERDVSSPVQLLTPEMLRDKLPPGIDFKIPEPGYDPLPGVVENMINEQLGRGKKEGDSGMKNKRDEKKTSSKEKEPGKSSMAPPPEPEYSPLGRKADDVDDEGVGTVYEPQ